MSNHNLLARKDTTAIIRAGIQRRHAAEKRFKWYGLIALSLGLLTVVLLFADIVVKGWPAFWQTSIRLDIYFDPQVLYQDGQQDPQTLATADYSQLWKKALRQDFPEATERTQLRALYGLISSGASFQLRDRVMADPSLIGQTKEVWLLADDTVDSFFKGSIDRAMSEGDRPIKDNQVVWLNRLEEQSRLETRFNTLFFTNGDSREPELAGIRGALVGSFYTILITLVLSFPIAVATAVYLEEFAPKNHWTDVIEVNINNLAAVPSIIFGLLGLAVFINFFGLPRSTPIVGSLVLTLMTLPVMIIASRVALKSVPPSIREAALGMGASRLQTVTDHVLPLAMPGILTGSILGMARALGETAPLLMIGMIAFVVDIPHSPWQPATVLPVQIFLWADLPERAFVERTSAAILVLLAFLVLMNATAIILRKRFERRW